MSLVFEVSTCSLLVLWTERKMTASRPAVTWVRPPAGVTVPLQSEVPGCVLNTQGWTSFQLAKEMFRCGHVNFG